MNVMKWGAIGIAGFLVVAAVLQVGNTIRLAAFARRREIGIMRAGRRLQPLHPGLPFLMASLVAAFIGVALVRSAGRLHVLRDLRAAETDVQHRCLDRLGRPECGHLGGLP